MHFLNYCCSKSKKAIRIKENPTENPIENPIEDPEIDLESILSWAHIEDFDIQVELKGDRETDRNLLNEIDISYVRNLCDLDMQINLYSSRTFADTNSKQLNAFKNIFTQVFMFIGFCRTATFWWWDTYTTRSSWKVSKITYCVYCFFVLILTATYLSSDNYNEDREVEVPDAGSHSVTPKRRTDRPHDETPTKRQKVRVVFSFEYYVIHTYTTLKK